ncbi:MAG: hypothetical protein EA401_01380 [Planctomycetota bacterium]|nr:MAG: hypothetical protein EA401_01380 [Planctomycetota bacterium]
MKQPEPSLNAVKAAIQAVNTSSKGPYYATTRKDAVRAAIQSESANFRSELASKSDDILSWYICVTLAKSGCLRLAAESAFRDCVNSGHKKVASLPGTDFLRTLL